MHPWHTVQFTGNMWQDEWSARTATFVAQQLYTDPDHDRGLRIQFSQQSQYRSLVAVLDMFRVVGLKKYWLDMWHRPTVMYPTTIYSYTLPPKPCPECQPALSLTCGIDSYYPLQPASSFIAELKEQFQQLVSPATWRPLFSPSWRYSTLLLLLLPLAAAWQLRRLAITNH